MVRPTHGRHAGARFGNGVHLDFEPNYPRSVNTDRIAPENVHRLIAQLRYCSGVA